MHRSSRRRLGDVLTYPRRAWWTPAGGGGGGTGPIGPGANAVTIEWTNSTTTFPVADGDVWISTDAAGANVIAGTLQTNSVGKATFMLDAPAAPNAITYYLWGQKDTVNPIHGQAFVAVAD